MTDLEIVTLRQPNLYNLAFAVMDQAYNVAFGITTAGTIVGINQLPAGSIVSGSNLTLPGNLTLNNGDLNDLEIIAISPSNYLGLAFAFVDQNYNVAWGITASGAVINYSGASGGGGSSSSASSGTASLNQTGNPLAPNVDPVTVVSVPDASNVQQVTALVSQPVSTFNSTSPNNYATVTSGPATVQLTSGEANNSTQPIPNQDQSWITFLKTPVGGGAPAIMKMNRWGQHQIPATESYENAYALSHVMISGQSLSIGAAALSALSTTQPFSNVMFNEGLVVFPGNDSNPWVPATSLVPLVEYWNSAQDFGETIASGFANTAYQWMLEAGVKMPLMMSNMGVGGTAYSGLKKGTQAYANGQLQVSTAKSLAAAAGYASYGVRALLIVHGEADEVNNVYDQNIATWQQNFEADTMALTGQSTNIPLILCQTSGGFNDQGSSFLPSGQYSPQLMLQASVNNPGKVILTGPSYMCQYNTAGPHMVAAGYRKNGAYFAKAWMKTVFQNKPWRPLSPRSIVRDGLNVYVDFWVPVPPITIDLVNVTQPNFVAGSKYGFEWWDSSGAPPAISAINVTGPTSIQIVLASVPTGTNKQLRYAYSFVATSPAGPTSGPRGNLRDSDPAVSYYGDALYNWCVHFNISVN